MWFCCKKQPWHQNPYIGNCKAADKYLSKKNTIGWLIPKFFNALLRGVSQVVFANNPLTGFIILLAIFLADLQVGLAATAAATAAIMTALLMKQDTSLITSGITTYNAVLVGSVTASLWTPIYSEPVSPKLWVVIIICAMLSVFVTSAMANIFSSFKIPLPCLTLPFNAVIIILFVCFMPPLVPSHEINSDILTSSVVVPTSGFCISESETTMSPSPLTVDIEEASHTNNDSSTAADTFLITDNKDDENEKYTEKSEKKSENTDLKDEQNHKLKWGSIFSGIICSMGQVYGINHIGASILMYVGLMIYSPLLCLVSFVGACVSSLSSLVFAAEPYDAVYNGVWGYNGLLAAGAVGGFFIVLTWHSFFTSMVNVIFTVLIQQMLMTAFAAWRLPVFTLPFVWSTLAFLSVTSSGEELPRVCEISFPELHRYEYIQRRAELLYNGELHREEINKNNEQLDVI